MDEQGQDLIEYALRQRPKRSTTIPRNGTVLKIPDAATEFLRSRHPILMSASQPGTTAHPDQPARHFPRDLIILPALSLLTLCLLLIGSELVARFFYPEQKATSCEVPDDKIGFRYKSHCTDRVKAAESPLVETTFNDCGYRSPTSCGTRPPSTLRIALIGSSVAEGVLVPYNQTIAGRLSSDLTRRYGLPVEVQNLGRTHCSVACMYHRMDEALALKPDLVLIAFAPFDIETILPSEVAQRRQPIPAVMPAGITRVAFSPIRSLKRILSESRAVLVAEHFLFQDANTYLNIALLNRDSTGFLRQPLSAAWQRRLDDTNLLLGEMAEKAHSAHIPIMLVEVPSAAQAAALSLQRIPGGIDPYAINARLAQISNKQGIAFVDVLSTFHQVKGSNRMYYLTDGHLDGNGYALVSRPVADRISDQPDLLSALGGTQRNPPLPAQ